MSRSAVLKCKGMVENTCNVRIIKDCVHKGAESFITQRKNKQKISKFFFAYFFTNNITKKCPIY